MAKANGSYDLGRLQWLLWEFRISGLTYKRRSLGASIREEVKRLKFQGCPGELIEELRARYACFWCPTCGRASRVSLTARGGKKRST